MVCGWRDHRLQVAGGVQTLPQRGEQKVPEHGLNLREGLQGPETRAGSGHVGSALTSASERPSPAARDGGHRILGQQGGSHMQGATPSPNPAATWTFKGQGGRRTVDESFQESLETQPSEGDKERRDTWHPRAQRDTKGARPAHPEPRNTRPERQWGRCRGRRQGGRLCAEGTSGNIDSSCPP